MDEMKPKKRWSKYVRECVRAWNKLSFMKKVPSRDAYLTILVLATVLNNMEKLHELLPPNARLMRDDWVQMKSFWQLYFRGADAVNHREELMEWLLSEQIQEFGATSYYADRIRQCAKDGSVITKRYLWSARVLSCEEREGYGDNHFQAELFGEMIDCSFLIHPDGRDIRVCLVFKERELTEQLTYGIVNQLPDFFLLTRCVTISSTRDGNYLNVAYSFEEEADELKEYWAPFEGYAVATAEFLSAAAAFLRNRGIPVEGDLSPIIG